MITSVAASLLLFTASEACSTETAHKWAKVKSGSGFTHYVDTKSIRVRGNLRDAWEKSVEIGGPAERISTSISRWRYDCKHRRSQLIYSESYLRDGTLVNSAGVPESQRIWDGIVPKSRAAASLQFVCAL